MIDHAVVERLWCEVLDVQRSDAATRGFVESGGSSLQAIQLATRLGRLLGREVSPVDVLQATSARDLLVAGGSAPAAGAPPVGDAAGLQPIALVQRRLWLLSRLDESATAYHVPMLVELRGDLDEPALEWAVRHVFGRHPGLRTRFVEVEGVPHQQVTDTVPEIRRADLAGDGDLEAVVRRDVERPFRLADEPPVRVSLLRQGPERHALLMTMHHLVADRTAREALLEDLADAYASRVQGLQPPADVRPPYAAFARWQHERLRAGDLDRERDHWLRELEGMPDLLPLPGDRLGRPAAAAGSARHAVRLAPALRERLRALARAERATPFMAMAAAYAALLHRCTDEPDLGIASPVSDRPDPAFDRTVGFFANTVVLRSRLAPDTSFRELLRAMRARVLGALAHRQYPFDWLVEALRPRRDVSHTPLTQAAIVHAALPGPRTAAGVELRPLELGGPFARFDLLLHVLESADAVECVLEYSTSLFSTARADRLAGHFLVLLEAALAAPDAPVSRLPVMPPDEERWLLVECNATGTPLATTSLVVDEVEARARAHPGRAALVSDGETLTYGELLGRAGAVADRLRALGAGPDQVVGVLLERSVEFVVAALGVMAAGAAYTPLDPALPVRRLRDMIEVGGIELAATEPARLALAGDLGLRAAATGGTGAVPSGRATTLDDLAYVLYTSGTTGEPKAIEVGQRALLNAVGWYRRDHGITESDRGVLYSATSFDILALDLWPYLCAGASVAVPPDEVRLDLARLERWLAEHSATVCFLPTPVMEAMARRSTRPATVRLWLTGGQALQWPARPLGVPLVNYYGPAECTVVTTTYVVRERDPDRPAPPIGRPIDNARVYVLDRNGEPVPAGVPGELHIGGDGLARGYRNRPALTAERFVRRAVRWLPEQRLYRTGDRVRFREDGELEFLSRLDRQVKVGGVRIELSEVEGTLERHPAARRVVATVEEDGADQRLVAYVLAERPDPDLVQELRALARQHLPAYMIPAVHAVADWPLTANGKVDVRALRAQAEARPEAIVDEPGNDVERWLHSTFLELLGRSHVGLRENFFDAGGSSLLAMHLANRFEAEYGVVLPASVLFRGATIEELAAHVASGGGA